jgi:hypothetical protein
MTGPYFIRAMIEGRAFLLGDIYPTRDAAERGMADARHTNAEKFGYSHEIIGASEATREEVAYSLRGIVDQRMYPEFHAYWVKNGKGYDPVADIVHAVRSGRMLPEIAITQLHELARQPREEVGHLSQQELATT